VEGYTNFLWVMILAFFKGVFGLDFIFISRLFGVLSGSAIFILLALLLNHPSRTVSPILYLQSLLCCEQFIAAVLGGFES